MVDDCRNRLKLSPLPRSWLARMRVMSHVMDERSQRCTNKSFELASICLDTLQERKKRRHQTPLHLPTLAAGLRFPCFRSSHICPMCTSQSMSPFEDDERPPSNPKIKIKRNSTCPWPFCAFPCSSIRRRLVDIEENVD